MLNYDIFKPGQKAFVRIDHPHARRGVGDVKKDLFLGLECPIEMLKN